MYVLPQPEVMRIGIEGINRQLIFRPMPPLSVIEGPLSDPTEGRAAMAFQMDEPGESVWLQVLQNDISPGRRLRAIAAEVSGPETSSMSTTSVSEEQLQVRPERLSKKHRASLHRYV